MNRTLLALALLCHPLSAETGVFAGADENTPTNPWEYPSRSPVTGYAYYFPLDASMVGKDLKVVLLGMKGGSKDLQP
ncbi:MAG: hypothetical protein N2A42_03910 [Luteolibacter sp.]